MEGVETPGTAHKVKWPPFGHDLSLTTTQIVKCSIGRIIEFFAVGSKNHDRLLLTDEPSSFPAAIRTRESIGSRHNPRTATPIFLWVDSFQLSQCITSVHATASNSATSNVTTTITSPSNASETPIYRSTMPFADSREAALAATSGVAPFLSRGLREWRPPSMSIETSTCVTFEIRQITSASRIVERRTTMFIHLLMS